MRHRWIRRIDDGEISDPRSGFSPGEFGARVTDHFKERVVGVGELAAEVAEDYAEDVGLDQAAKPSLAGADLAFGPLPALTSAAMPRNPLIRPSGSRTAVTASRTETRAPSLRM